MTPHGRITESPGGVEARMLGLENGCDPALSPGAVRASILAQHRRIRSLLRALEEKATHLLASSVPSLSERDHTRQLALVLCSVMASHIEFENRVLAPVLETVDAWGPVRAQRLREEHREQLELLRAYAHALEHAPHSGAELARSAWQLIALLRNDMEQEEAGVLNSGLLSDVAVAVDVETG
jgi:hypothetical protein